LFPSSSPTFSDSSSLVLLRSFSPLHLTSPPPFPPSHPAALSVIQTHQLMPFALLNTSRLNQKIILKHSLVRFFLLLPSLVQPRKKLTDLPFLPSPFLLLTAIIPATQPSSTHHGFYQHSSRRRCEYLSRLLGGTTGKGQKGGTKGGGTKVWIANERWS